MSEINFMFHSSFKVWFIHIECRMELERISMYFFYSWLNVWVRELLISSVPKHLWEKDFEVILVCFDTFFWCSSKTNICTYLLLRGFLNCTVCVVQPVAAVFHPWVLWSWFIRRRGPWAAISPFPSALWLPDNIQLSLMCHQGLMVRLSALLFYCGAHWDENIYTLGTVTHGDTHTCLHEQDSPLKYIIVFPVLCHGLKSFLKINLCFKINKSGMPSDDVTAR